MSIVKRNPQYWLPSLFDDMFRHELLGGTTGRAGISIPAVNIKENENSFTVELAAPGRSKEDFKIELDNEMLSISTEERKENEVTEKEGEYTRKEFSYRSFQRSFSLPESVDTANIVASYTNGILEIALPKKEEAKAQPKRMIEIG